MPDAVPEPLLIEFVGVLSFGGSMFAESPHAVIDSSIAAEMRAAKIFFFIVFLTFVIICG